MGEKTLQFSTDIGLYLANGNEAHGCYGTVIGSHYALYPMVTFLMTFTNPVFKVTSFLVSKNSAS